VAIIWTFIEGALIYCDKSNAKGTTKIDSMSRLFNFISFELAIYSPLLSLIWPMLRFYHLENLSITLLGTALICLGFVLRYWSIATLGKYFRTTVEFEEGHRIIQKGPYKLIRHPSYSGMIVFFIGYGLVSQNWVSFLIVIIVPTLALLYRIHIEEEAFTKQFGIEYENYKSKTKKLIPGLW